MDRHTSHKNVWHTFIYDISFLKYFLDIIYIFRKLQIDCQKWILYIYIYHWYLFTTILYNTMQQCRIIAIKCNVASNL
jgi:hypothetical protein